MRVNRSCTYPVGAQQGFTLLEILVAMTIGLFMLGAILTIEQGNRTTFVNQNNLGQLQDSERMAITMVADVVQSAGYFPNPTSYTQADLNPVTPFAVGQSMTGTYNASSPGDTIGIRYETLSGDSILNCSGSPNGTGAAAVYTNTFSVVNGQLVCDLSVNGAAATRYFLIGDQQNIVVTNMSVMYGVNTSGSANNNVDTYMNAGQVTNWSNVCSVVISLTFSNPLYGQGSKQPQSFTVQRVINVMNRTGPVL